MTKLFTMFKLKECSYYIDLICADILVHLFCLENVYATTATEIIFASVILFLSQPKESIDQM